MIEVNTFDVSAHTKEKQKLLSKNIEYRKTT